MADLRIVDAPEIPTENITGEEKLPTGGSGNYSITLDSVADYTKTKKDLADNTSVDGKVNGVRQELNTHIEDSTNPHQVTKGQIGLGNVDNTADLDKPVSNSTQATIISAVAPKADKTYVDNALSEQTQTVNTALSNLSTAANKFYPTLAEAIADIANIVVNQPVTIGETANGGLWYKTTAEATTLTKSAYDPVEQAKNAIVQQAGLLSNLPLVDRAVTASGSTISGAVLTVPSGQTGRNSYVMKLIEFYNSSDIASKKIKIIAQFKKSANFAAAGTTLVHNILARVHGVSKADQQVPSSVVITNIDSTTVEVSAEYIVEAATSLQVGITAIVGASNPAASETVTVEALANVKLFSDSATMSDISDLYIKKNIAENTSGITSLTTAFAKTSEIELDSTNFTQDLRELNGATLLPKGLKFPIGQTGLTSFIRLKVLANLLKNYSYTARISAVVTTSDDFFEKFGLININIAKYQTASGAITVNEGKTSSNIQKINKNKYVVSAVFDSTAGYEAYALWFQMLSSTDTSIERTVQYEKVYLQILSVNSADYVAQNTLATQYKADTLRAMIPTNINVIQFYRPQYTKIVKVKANGGGDFTTIEAAFAAHGGGTDFYNRVKYEIYEGNYTPLNQYIPKYADLIGVGKRDNIHIFCHMPDNTDPTIIENSQPLWMNETSKLKGLRITAKNARYPLHSDSMNSDKKAIQEVEDCWVEHLGNDGARAWQTANGGNPSLVRNQHYALGCGSHADFMFFSRRTVWKSSNRPFYVHNQRDFTSPAYVEIDGGAVICTSNDSDAILFMSLGSGQVCNVVIKNNPTVRGRLTVTASNSLSTVVDNQIADRNGEWAVEINGGSIPFYMEDYDQCLTLKSVAGANSSVRVSGTAADAIFGKYPDYQDGATNLVGLVHSRFAATATNPSVTANIGTRLGDCTTTAKTLNIVFDGSISKTITLNANYTAMSNNDIVSALNTALADANRSFTITSSPYTNKAHVKQTAHESMILNTSSIAILKGAAVKQSTNMNCGEMANGDAGFIGIALENILPNQIGRIQKSGYICKRMIWTGHTFVVGDFGTVNTTGSILKSTTSGVLKCVDVIADEPVFEILI